MKFFLTRMIVCLGFASAYNPHTHQKINSVLGPRRARRNAAERQFLIEELMTRPALPPAPPKMTQCEKFGLLVADLMENIAARRRTAVMTKILDIIGEEEEEADD